MVKALKGPGKGFNQHCSDEFLHCQPWEHSALGLLGTARAALTRLVSQGPPLFSHWKFRCSFSAENILSSPMGLENQHLNFSSPCSLFLALSSSSPATTAKHQCNLGIHREAETPSGNPVLSPAETWFGSSGHQAWLQSLPIPQMKVDFCRQAAGRDGTLEGQTTRSMEGREM